MSLKFSYTCPKIDKEIDNAKSIIEDFLDEIIVELCPLISKETIYDLRKEWTNDLYNRMESAFETVRETNEDMRSQADNQIDELECEISDLKEQISSLENELYKT